MTDDTDALRDIFLDVTGEETLTEHQEEAPSHDPIGERETELERHVSAAALDDGLGDAVAGSGAPDLAA